MTLDPYPTLAVIVLITAIFWVLPSRFRFSCLGGLTLAVLLWLDPLSAATLGAITAVTSLCARPGLGSGWRIGGVAVIVVFLLGFKIRSGASLGESMQDTVIPLGLSYYALRAIHLLLEAYKGRVASASALDIWTYLGFVPTLVLGPIHRFTSFERERRRHRWSYDVFAEGLDRLVHGLFKVVLVHNVIIIYGTAAVRDQIGPDRVGLLTYVDMVSIGLGLYVQFSGYSDIAIGFARLLGIRVMENFDYPYFKANISDFWRAWHISLTSFAREYVYAGVVAATRSPGLGAVATLMVIGFWHEVSLRYLLWGGYHGLGIFAWQRFQGIKPTLPKPRSRLAAQALHAVSVLVTLHFVWLSFLLVREPNLAAVWAKLAELFTGGW